MPVALRLVASSLAARLSGLRHGDRNGLLADLDARPGLAPRVQLTALEFMHYGFHFVIVFHGFPLILIQMKRCTRCKELKDISAFYRNTMTRGRTPLSQCKICMAARTKEARRDPSRREKWKEYARRASIRSRYGIEPEDYDRILEKQSSVCAICRGINIGGRKLAIDHDKETKKIRGILCDRCNRGIGFMRHDKYLLQRSIEYLSQE